MNALPILERGLRLRARSRGIYWSRFDLRQSISSAAEGALAALQKARHWTA